MGILLTKDLNKEYGFDRSSSNLPMERPRHDDSVEAPLFSGKCLGSSDNNIYSNLEYLADEISKELSELNKTIRSTAAMDVGIWAAKEALIMAVEELAALSGKAAVKMAGTFFLGPVIDVALSPVKAPTHGEDMVPLDYYKSKEPTGSDEAQYRLP